MDKTIKADLAKLDTKERKIYNSIMSTFSATSHDSAYDIAIQGGVTWNYNYQ